MPPIRRYPTRSSNPKDISLLKNPIKWLDTPIFPNESYPDKSSSSLSNKKNVSLGLDNLSKLSTSNTFEKMRLEIFVSKQNSDAILPINGKL